MAQRTVTKKVQEKQEAVKVLSTTPSDNPHLPFTPPATVERAQPTSNATDTTRLTRLLHSYAHKASTSDTGACIDITVNSEQYEALKEAIKRLFRRHDFDPHRKILTLRMPGTIHDFFTRYLSNEIKQQLLKIASGGGQAASFAAEIDDGGTARLYLKRDESATLRKEPDAQFQHRNAKYPGLVIEVSYSQDGKRLKRIAQDYIQYSKGNIRVILGVDIITGGEASLSIWRSKKTWSADKGIHVLKAERTVHELFRTSAGESTNESTNLELHLADFATEALPCEQDVPISIPYKILYDFLCLSDQMKRLRESSQEGVESKDSVEMERGSSSSAEEQLQSDDEERFQRMEDRVERRTAQEDKEYVEPVKRRRRA